jgi:hypothetical protein
MVQDRLAPVHLAAVDMTPTNVSVGDVVKLTGTARDENGDELTYTWSVDGQPVGNGQTVYWRAAVAPGTHGVSLAVDDGEVTHASKVEVSVFVKAKEPTMSHDDGGLIKGVRQALLSVEKRNPKAHGRLSAALTADDAIQKLAVEIDWADPSTRTRLLESAFLRAVDVFPEVMWAEWLKGKRPPCSQYPGTWPFCDPNK